MTFGGALFMAISWALIIGLNVFCFYELGRNGRQSGRRPQVPRPPEHSSGNGSVRPRN